MNEAKNFLALALAACINRQYEEAGVLLAQASKCDGAEALAMDLANAVPPLVQDPTVQGNPMGTLATRPGAADTADDTIKTIPIGQASDEEEWEAENESDEEECDDEDEDDMTSTSSVTRRKTTSLFHIGKVLASSMAAGLDDDVEPSGNEDDSEADPDFAGEPLVPASFSSVRVKAVTVSSPVKLKAAD